MNAGLLRTTVLASALYLSGCGKAPDLPEGVKIIAGADVEKMLEQCSRGAPAKGERTWQPTASDVSEFEVRLTAELPHQLDNIDWLLPSEKIQLEKFPTGFWREYVGIVRKGQRYIYGNFGPVLRTPGPPGASMQGPTDICDGGPVFFGTEYDTVSTTITHWAFNGPSR